MIKKFKIDEITSLFRFGKPFKTPAVTRDITGGFENSVEDLPYFSVQYERESKVVITFEMKDDDFIYGLGQMLSGLNKRNFKYKFYNNDDPLHTEDKESLYGTHPFAIVYGEKHFGFFIDYPGEMDFDIGFTEYDKMIITIKKSDFDLYIFTGSNQFEIIKSYLQLTGTPYIPPKWAFGFQQSRWSYPDEKAITNIVQKFKDDNIPLDAVYVDIDYMDNYKVFTIDKSKFCDFKAFSQKMLDLGVRLIPIIDPGVRVEDGFDVYEEGVKQDYFCQSKNGGLFTGAVWPGLVHFPDFTQKDVRKWWGDLYHGLLDSGAAGFWNDMNEPSVFYTKESLEKSKETIAGMEIKNSWDFFTMRDAMAGIMNRRAYYEEMQHKTDFDTPVSNDEIHNLYGIYMTEAAVEGYRSYAPGKRYFLLSRSSYAGQHRMCAIWTGDNHSWWEHIKVNIQMLMTLNSAGFFYVGADICGFGGDVSPELAVRWMQCGILNPLFRNHSAVGTRDQEPFAFDTDTNAMMKAAIVNRYALLEHFYSNFLRSVLDLKPFITPVFFQFKDKDSFECDDQLLIGDNLMAAPVYKAGMRRKNVYLPQCQWLYWNMSDHLDRDFTILSPGHHVIDTPLSGLPLFIREDSMLLLISPQESSKDISVDEVDIIAFVNNDAVYTYVSDDGESYDLMSEKLFVMDILISKVNDEFNIETKIKNDRLDCKIKRINFEIYSSDSGLPVKKVVNLG